MTEISFYFNVPNRSAYACRLVRKALRQGAAVVVTGPPDSLQALDSELWSFAATEFVPHQWVEQASEVPASLRESTAWLAPEPIDAPVHGILLNLGRESPRGFESFARLFEVVSTDEADRHAARERWKAYARRGYEIRQHEAAE